MLIAVIVAICFMLLMWFCLRDRDEPRNNKTSNKTITQYEIQKLRGFVKDKIVYVITYIPTNGKWSISKRDITLPNIPPNRQLLTIDGWQSQITTKSDPQFFLSSLAAEFHINSCQ